MPQPRPLVKVTESSSSSFPKPIYILCPKYLNFGANGFDVSRCGGGGHGGGISGGRKRTENIVIPDRGDSIRTYVSLD